ncbi:hypothetical protein NEOLEDRAFT_1143454 [Neolentinus lepideus HHB14362 ss-1]|uniref:Uncharacterized protein n=1 Tax=Neolentinus lepideus HHB14362 ss-1 TaxID=1314782 RepID=A0A165MIS8_9AGAM|nr:hypothetical protein NEOLEDRAFT_1143454 [Neolentinus lepideus HHB14362 ss-1]
MDHSNIIQYGRSEKSRGKLTDDSPIVLNHLNIKAGEKVHYSPLSQASQAIDAPIPPVLLNQPSPTP